MITTTYLQIDFTNIVEVVANYTNCSPNSGTPPNALFSGSDTGAWATGGNYANNSGGLLAYSWDVDHDSPSTRVPVTARIHRITIQQQLNSTAATGEIDGTAVGLCSPSVGAQASIQSSNPNPLWITSDNRPVLSNTDALSNVPTFDIDAAVGPESDLIQIVFDFELNPNGDFPLLFMDYATFIANFTSYDIIYIAAGVASSSGASSGNQSVSCLMNAANIQIAVEWDDPFTVVGWTNDTPTLTLPDNTITLSRPVPIISEGDEDVEVPEKIKIGNKEIGPNDPWVVLWTKYRIVVKIPPDEWDDTVNVQIQFVGTEFEGFVLLDATIVVMADLSGIYQLDIAAHTDTLYDHAITPTTQEVAIPAPFFVTHFIDNKETDILHFAGTRMRIKGSGTAHQQLLSLDYVNTLEFGNTLMRTSNNISPFKLANFNEQHAALRVWTDAFNEFMNVDEIIIFFKKLFTGYPQ